MSNLPEQNESLSQYGKLLAGLARAKVDFAVAGGLAVIFNGYARFTLDADIIVDGSPENLERLLATLRGWGEGWATELSVGDFTAEEGAVRVVEDFELDIFTRLRGKCLGDFRPTLRFIKWDDVKIPYLSPRDLIHCKQDSVREKDRLDVIALTEIQRREQDPGL
jgi:hypothetical protein